MWLTLAFITAVVIQAQVVPTFNCWFPTYVNGTRVNNLVFSYNSSSGTDVILPIATGTNQLFPAEFDGQQPDVFKSGYYGLILVLSDTNNVLGGGAIGWLLDGSVANVTSGQITPSSQCSAALNGSCPIDAGMPLLQYFCDDGVYCNGPETCFSMGLFGIQTVRTTGTCHGANAGIQCPSGSLCQESTLDCAAPTDAPTVAPTDSPTAVPTPPPTDAPTRAPTEPAPVQIIPVFYCWFYTTEPVVGQVVNLGLGYNNTGAHTLSRPTTLAPIGDNANNIMPSGYNGDQPTLFQRGYDPLAYVLKDLAGVLLSNGTIRWRLTMNTLIITQTLLTPSAECSVLQSPTDDHDIQVISQCTVMTPDCTAYNTYCHGVTQCNFTSEQCDPVIPNYDPCQGLQSQVSPQTPIVFTCVEALQQCVAYVNCTDDQQCNDGLICNGREYCVNNGTAGVCYGQANLTIVSLCGTANAVCIEGVGCQSTTQVSPTTTLAIAFGCFVVGAVVVIFFYFTFSAYTPRPIKMKK